MRIQDMFVDDINRKINGVIKVDQEDTTTEQELNEKCLELIRKVREREYPVKILFGLEVCWFRGQEDFIAGLTKDRGFDFPRLQPRNV